MPVDRLVVVCGTGTEVGKTWVAARLLGEVRRLGLTVAARKPAQSFELDDDGEPVDGPTDAAVLGEASGEEEDVVCLPVRNYPLAMAPPMAAEALGLPPFTLADLAGEVRWPSSRVDLGLVETAGGVRSPQAADGDAVDLVALLAPDLVVLVADAGLGTINGVRLSVAALGPTVPTVIVLNRFDPDDDLHRRNRQWLADRDGLEVVVTPGGEAELAGLAAGRGGEPAARLSER